MTATRREAALGLAEEVLTDMELSRIPAPELLKKTSRLARLLDDDDALAWLSFEMHGYPTPLTPEAGRAARRSNRIARPEPGEVSEGVRFWTGSLSRLQASVDARKIQLQSAHDVGGSAPAVGVRERNAVAGAIADSEDTIGKVLGALHSYVADKEIELRFGTAVENALTVVRNEVDAQIAALVPSAASGLAAAFENASSGNPEHWANAAAACRRLLKTIADELRPAGDPIGGRLMTDQNYINRLVDWIESQQAAGTLVEVVTADLEDFGRRIDAIASAGNKGAHANVTKYEASRFITGTYLLLGDILRLRQATAIDGSADPS